MNQSLRLIIADSDTAGQKNVGVCVCTCVACFLISVFC